MTTWNYRVFREETGEYVIREVFYDEEGVIMACTEDSVEPMGESLEELARDIAAFQRALNETVLTMAEVDAVIKTRPADIQDPHKTISHQELIEKLGLNMENEQEAQHTFAGAT